jgi:exodeoxyribonuclease VII large subunit
VDDVHARLLRAGRAVPRAARHRVEVLRTRLAAASPFARVAGGRHRLERIRARLGDAMARRFVQARHRFVAATGRLDSLSPLAVLGRGYSLTRTPDGAVVRSARELHAGDPVRVLLHRGSLDCRVERTREDDERPQV